MSARHATRSPDGSLPGQGRHANPPTDRTAAFRAAWTATSGTIATLAVLLVLAAAWSPR